MLDLYRGLCLLNIVSTVHNLRFDSKLTGLLMTIIHISTDIGNHNTDNYSTFKSAYAYIDCRQTSCYIDFKIAIALLGQTCRLSPNTLPSLLTEVAKAYLHVLLNCLHIRCSDFHIRVNCFLKVYMASLYCSTDQYRTTIDHCQTAIASLNSLHCIERKLLPQFHNDNNIAK